MVDYFEAAAAVTLVKFADLQLLLGYNATVRLYPISFPCSHPLSSLYYAQ